jgi:acetyl esterase/lipase
MRKLGLCTLLACVLLGGWSHLSGADAPSFTRKEDVIYGRKFGTALTLDVITPAKPNGAAVIVAISGGWFSSHDGINPAGYRELLSRGYTVFAVVHGSQPKFAIPEILKDMHRATRYIRAHARDYAIDPERIGITGGSAGGHLSLMQATAGDLGDPKSKDPIDRVSSRVQAVACFFPPTDFLNYGEPGKIALGRGTLAAFKAPFDFTELNPKTRSFDLITDEQKRLAIGKEISPVYHATSEAPPTLIIHGDADTLVPIQQGQVMIAALKKVGVPAELVVKHGVGHTFKGMEKEPVKIVDWFDKYLKTKTEK